jgi:hypothetical protein
MIKSRPWEKPCRTKYHLQKNIKQY